MLLVNVSSEIVPSRTLLTKRYANATLPQCAALLQIIYKRSRSRAHVPYVAGVAVAVVLSRARYTLLHSIICECTGSAHEASASCGFCLRALVVRVQCVCVF